MSIDATDWHGVALAKLTKVMGESVGLELAQSVMKELGIASISSAAELQDVAEALSRRGGFAAAVGGLLGVHVAIHGRVSDRA